MINRIIHKIHNLWLAHKFHECGEHVYFENVKYLFGSEFISIGAGTCFGFDLCLTAWKINDSAPELKIGQNCSFGSWNHISCANKIIIGDGLLTGKWVSIVDNDHGLTDKETLQIRPWERPVVIKCPVIIGKNVWIGDKATILSGVIIGDGAVIAANTVVTRNVPAYSVVAGNPGRIVKSN